MLVRHDYGTQYRYRPIHLCQAVLPERLYPNTKAAKNTRTAIRFQTDTTPITVLAFNHNFVTMFVSRMRYHI